MKDVFSFLNRLAADRTISHAEFRLLSVMAIRANVDGAIWYGADKFAALVGIPERNVRRMWARLADRGCLSRRKVAKGQALPSGVLAIRDQVVHYVHWQADVMGNPTSRASHPPLAITTGVTPPMERVSGPPILDATPSNAGHQAPMIPGVRPVFLSSEKNNEKNNEKIEEKRNRTFSSSCSDPTIEHISSSNFLQQALQRQKDLTNVGPLPALPSFPTERSPLSSYATAIVPSTIPAKVPATVTPEKADRIRCDVKRFSENLSRMCVTEFSMYDLSRVVADAQAVKVGFPPMLREFFTCIERHGHDIVTVKNGLIVEIKHAGLMDARAWRRVMGVER